MEFIDGITLLQLLRKKGALQLRDALEIGSQFLAGLEAIHRAGLVHRDFKPENVMITRAGRVVVMDFGVARELKEVTTGLSGTTPYIAPEELADGTIDARSDIFAAGVVLAEMIHPEGIKNRGERERVWKAVRSNPPQLPETPWNSVIAKAVAGNPEDRFASAATLSRALEEVTQRIEKVDEKQPYPGLLAFGENDAEYFFGRELEVETVLRKLQQLHLTALIGPSGAGKTSFLRAGLTPALPPEWSRVFCTPGDAPLTNLKQALVAQLSTDPETIRKVMSLEDSETAVGLLKRWRQNHLQALLIVDRFEELFTLNPREKQFQFADLLLRAALEADVRVLLAMRDDFLIHCKEQTSLSPIFSELTAILPLSGPALRRALVQPALRCGYQFEDETLTDEMLTDVERERGALPLMAFAASRLWEKRDRKSGLLRRAAYQEIGGIAGALAQHAEATMERIGSNRQNVVREIFRNLITAQNTRAARDTHELLSVFSNREDAEEVLRTLIDARLLTSFESKQESGETRSRVEIIHESLLSSWPRLVRWQTQDADSAQFRDQLRQAAEVWDHRERPEDLLWTGTAYLEFCAWRSRYQGGLTTKEEAFVNAMTQRATKRRRQRRIAVAAIFVVLLLVLAVISHFWQGAEVARKGAVAEAHRAEASKLLAIAQLNADTYPSAALAYAMKSLELSDTKQGRFFALRMVQQAPPVIRMPANQKGGMEGIQVAFSPDGKWVAAGGYMGVQIRAFDGRAPVLTKIYRSMLGFTSCAVLFGPNSDRLFTNLNGDVRVLSVPSGKELHRWKLPSEETGWAAPSLYRAEDGLLIITPHAGRRSVFFSAGYELKPQLLGEIPRGCSDLTHRCIDVGGKTLIYTDDELRKVYLRSLKDWNQPPRVMLEQQETISGLAICPDRRQFATTDSSGQIRIWPIDSTSSAVSSPLRTLQATGLWVQGINYDPTGRLLAVFGGMGGRPKVYIWDLTAPSGAAPFYLSSDSPLQGGRTFHPSGTWIATANVEDVALWPIASQYPRRLAHPGLLSAALTPDGEHLLSAGFDGAVRSWPLSNHPEEDAMVILRDNFNYPYIEICPETKRFAVSAGGRVLVANFDGSDLRTLKGFSSGAVITAIAFGDKGRLVAAGALTGPRKDKVMRVWDFESGQVQAVIPLAGAGEGFDGILSLEFIDANRLVGAGYKGLQLFDLSNKSNTLLSDKIHRGMAISRDRRTLVSSRCESLDRTGSSEKAKCEFVKVNLQTNATTVLKSFGYGMAAAIDPTDHFLVTGAFDGLVRVGRLSGEEPHIIFGHNGKTDAVDFSPDGRWIASSARDDTIRLTPMPDLSKPPPHTLPHNQFLEKLKSFTNLRVVADPGSTTGWKVETSPFPGWNKVPAW
jgi:WD40 repeat protein